MCTSPVSGLRKCRRKRVGWQWQGSGGVAVVFAAPPIFCMLRAVAAIPGGNNIAGMGRTYLYECLRCGYRAKAAGKEDRGQEFFVQSIICSDCKELYDAVVKVKMPRGPALPIQLGQASRRGRAVGPARSGTRAMAARAAPRFEAMINRLPAGGARRFRWVRFEPACPVSAFHRVAPWNEPGRCTRCGVYLERSPLPFKIWD